MNENGELMWRFPILLYDYYNFGMSCQMRKICGYNA